MKLSEGESEIESEIDLRPSFKIMVIRLGIGETPEMEALRARIVEAMRADFSGEQSRTLYAQFEELAEELVTAQLAEFEHSGEATASDLAYIGASLRVGVQILKAGIFRDAGNEEYCDEFLYNAIIDSNNAGLVYERTPEPGPDEEYDPDFEAKHTYWEKIAFLIRQMRVPE
jgi:hypothetical protein